MEVSFRKLHFARDEYEITGAVIKGNVRKVYASACAPLCGTGTDFGHKAEVLQDGN
jgi:hypothetical protein